MAKILETPRLILRTWQDSDLEPFSSINKDKQVMEFFPATLSTEETREFIKKLTTHFEEHGYTFYATELKETKELIGFCGLLYVNFNAPFSPTTEIAWRLSSKHWGKGYAPEAAKAVLDYAFTSLKLDKIVSFTVPENKKSIRVMQKIGMQRNSSEDFHHPKLPKDHRLSRHVLYRITPNLL